MSNIKFKVLVFLSLVLLIGSSFLSCDKTNKTIDKLKKNFEGEGYTITEYDTILDNINVTRVLAVKGDSYFDVCYDVSESDISKVNDFYASKYSNYYKFNSNSGKGTVICCSDNETYDISGVKIVELEPIVIH